MKKRFLLPITAFLSMFLSGCRDESIGIIGGADGPTAILLSYDLKWMLIELLLLAAAVGFMVFLIIRKRKKK